MRQDRRQETRDRRQETRDRRQETRDVSQEDERQETSTFSKKGMGEKFWGKKWFRGALLFYGAIFLS